MFSLWYTQHISFDTYNSAVKKFIINMNSVLHLRKLKNNLSTTDINPSLLILDSSTSSIILYYLIIYIHSSDALTWVPGTKKLSELVVNLACNRNCNFSYSRFLSSSKSHMMLTTLIYSPCGLPFLNFVDIAHLVDQRWGQKPRWTHFSTLSGLLWLESIKGRNCMTWHSCYRHQGRSVKWKKTAKGYQGILQGSSSAM